MLHIPRILPDGTQISTDGHGQFYVAMKHVHCQFLWLIDVVQKCVIISEAVSYAVCSSHCSISISFCRSVYLSVSVHESEMLLIRDLCKFRG